MSAFPQNPSDGTIVEIRPGEFYLFHAGSQSWTRVDGYQFGLATQASPGLMSKDDLRKLNSIILPPPSSSLSGEDCDITFRNGTVTLFSTDESLSIRHDLPVNNPVTGQSHNEPWQIHENTAGYDFRLNVDQLIQEIESRGRLTKIQLAGDEGPRGPRGDPGTNLLDTGPVGVTGEDGVNSPFGGTLSTEGLTLELSEDNRNRAIVSIENESTDEGDFLVVTRANIGDPDACPDRIAPSDFESPWLLVLDQKEGRITRKVVQTTDDCTLTCRICVSNIYYLNIEGILEAVKERFRVKLAELKFSKENIVRAWLRVMSSIFNEQKYALCCALENCETRKRNQTDKRWIEGQRVAAAVGDLSLTIDNDKEDKLAVESPETCDLDTIFDGSDDGRVIYGKECGEYLVKMKLDARIHNKDPRTSGFKGRNLVARLPEGDYFAEIVECCANFGFAKPKPKPTTKTAPPAPPPAPGRPTTPQPPRVQLPSLGEIYGGGGTAPILRTLGPSVTAAFLGTAGPQSALLTPGRNPAMPTAQPAAATPSGSGSFGQFRGPGGGVPTGLREPFSNTPNGRKTAGDLTCKDVQMSGQIGNQPGDTLGSKFMGPVSCGSETVKKGNIYVSVPHYGSMFDIGIGNPNCSPPTERIDSEGFIGNDCRAVSSRTTALPANWDNTGAWSGQKGPIHGLPANGDLVAGCIPKPCDDGGINANPTPGKWTGRVAILHKGPVRGPSTTDDTRVVDRVTETPNLGFFDDLFAGRNAYIGSNIIFHHSGGTLKVWIPDPDKLNANNDGGVMLGIRSRKCVDTQIDTGNITEVTAAPIPMIYVYRDKISSGNLIGSFKPFLAEGKTHVQNYGLSGGSAHLSVGPTLEAEVSKAFFVLADDGLGFYQIHNVANGELQTSVLTTYIVDNNNASAPVTPIVEDGDGTVSPVDSQFAEIFRGSWNIDDDTEGVVLAPFSTTDDEWTLTLDEMDFGKLGQFVAVDGEEGNREFTLSKGAGSEAIPVQEEADTAPFLLCRSLKRSCNVPDGMGGRYALGVINRVKGENFRICRILPEWSVPPLDSTLPAPSAQDNVWIRKPITFAPHPYPCGASLCDVKYEVATGTDGQIRPLNIVGTDDLPTALDGFSLDMVFLVHASQSLGLRAEKLANNLSSIQKYMIDRGFENTRFSIVMFGGATADDAQVSILQPFTYDTEIASQALKSATYISLPTNPGYGAIKWAAENVPWFDGAVKVITIVTDEDSSTQSLSEGQTDDILSTDGVTAALKAKGIILNGIVALKAPTYSTLTCWSEGYRYHECTAGPGRRIVEAWVITRHSVSTVDFQPGESLNRNGDLGKRGSFGITGDGKLWVDHGARATFGIRYVDVFDTNQPLQHSYGTPNSLDDPLKDTIKGSQFVGQGLAYDNEGVLFDITDLDTVPLEPLDEDAIADPVGTIRTQPWWRLRLGFAAYAPDGLGSSPRFERFDFASLGLQHGHHTIVGQVFDSTQVVRPLPGAAIRGALVHLRLPGITGTKIIASSITDIDGRYALKVPCELMPSRGALGATVEVQFYPFQTSDQWLFDAPLSESSAHQYVTIGSKLWGRGDAEPLYQSTGLDYIPVIPYFSGSPADLHGPECIGLRMENIRSERIDGFPKLAFTLSVDDGPRRLGGGRPDLDFNDLQIRVSHPSVPCLPSGSASVEDPPRILSSSTRSVVGPAPERRVGTEVVNTWSNGTVETITTYPAFGGFPELRLGSTTGTRAGTSVNGIIPISPIGTFTTEVVIPDFSRTFVPNVGGGGFTSATVGGGVIVAPSTILSASEVSALEQKVSLCGGFFHKFKVEKYREISLKTFPTRGECADKINDGPSPVYHKVSGVPMNADTLEGNVVSVSATVQCLPGSLIRVALYDRQQRAVVLRSQESARVVTWETLNWSISEVDHYLNPYALTEDARQQLLTTELRDDPRIQTQQGRVEILTDGMSIKLKDLFAMSFEWINPDTGVITYIGQVKVGVDVASEDGERHTVFVDIANFEPFGRSAKEPGEIPLVVFSPQEIVLEPGMPGATAGATFTIPDGGGFITPNTAIQIGKMLTLVLFVETIDPNPSGSTQVLIGANDSETLDNLKALLNNSGTNGVEYWDPYLLTEFGAGFSAVFGDTEGTFKTDTTLRVQARTEGIAGNGYPAHLRIGLEGASFGEGILASPASPTGVFSVMVGGVDPIAQGETIIKEPTEEDFSAYLENWWTITGPDEFLCERRKELCNNCTVEEIGTLDDEGCKRIDIHCVETPDSVRVPLSKYIFTTQCPSNGCQMHYKQIEWYERGWRIGACCGALIEVEGVKWIVVKRSIGTDISCGGGESDETPCIKQFIEDGRGHPALAWPTVNGEEFIGRPTSGFARFTVDTQLSDAILEALGLGQATEYRGNLTASNVGEKIPLILFPRS